MNPVFAEWKKYNANTRNASVGDCVKRALSFALGLDYDKVSAELNQIKREVRARQYNQGTVFNKFLSDRGYKWINCSKSLSDPNTGEVLKPESVKVSEFCQLLPTGTYILLVDPKPNPAWPNHMTVVMDGDLYDSWNSSDDYVVRFVVVSAGTTQLNSVDYKSMGSDMLEYVYELLDQWMGKMPYTHLYVKNHRSSDIYTGKIVVVCEFDEENEVYPVGMTLSHVFVIKFSPRFSADENLSIAKKKFKQKLYDWLYEIRRPVELEKKATTAQINPLFRGDRRLLMKFPDWAVPMTLDAYDYGLQNADSGSYRFYAVLEPFPDDTRTSEVTFYTDTISELKWQLEQYNTKRKRYNYDY